MATRENEIKEIKIAETAGNLIQDFDIKLKKAIFFHIYFRLSQLILFFLIPYIFVCNFVKIDMAFLEFLITLIKYLSTVLLISIAYELLYRPFIKIFENKYLSFKPIFVSMICRFSQLILLILIPYCSVVYFIGKIGRYSFEPLLLITLISSILISLIILELLYRDFGIKDQKNSYEYITSKLSNELFAYNNEIGIYLKENRDKKLAQTIMEIRSEGEKNEIHEKKKKNMIPKKELKKSEFNLDKILEAKGLNKLALQSEFENFITNLPMIKVGKWLLFVTVLIVIGIFTGGTIYSGININSISEIAESANTKIKELSKDANERAKEFNTIILKAQYKIDEELRKAEVSSKKIRTEILHDIEEIEAILKTKSESIDTQLAGLETKIQLKFQNITRDVDEHKILTIEKIDSKYGSVKGFADKKIFDIDDQFVKVKNNAETKIISIGEQYKRVNSHAETKISDIEKEFNKVNSHANSIVIKLNNQPSKVERFAENSKQQIKTIEDNYSKSIETDIKMVHDEAVKSKNQINEVSQNAVSYINTEKENAINIIDISNLKEFPKFKEQIESLKESGGKLNLYNIRKFLDNSIFYMLGIFLFILILTVIFNFAFSRKANN